MNILPKHINESLGLQPDQLAAMSPDQRRSLLKKLLQQQAEAAKCFGMSSGQQGLWYAFRRDPTSTAFNVFLPTRVVSHLDLDALSKAINFLVQRHPCLRTTFSDKEATLQQTVHSSLPPEFEIFEALDFDDRQLREQVVVQTQRPFDLEIGPLLRLAVFVRGHLDYVVVATTHHMVVDFWSLVLVLTELREIYRSFVANTEPSIPPASGNYASFVAEQQAMLDGPQADDEWRHWQQTLEGAPQVLNWFTDFERPSTFTGRADVVPLALSTEIASLIKQVASDQSTTSTAVVLAALQVFTARYTRQNDFLIGIPFSGRAHRKYEGTVGFFVNMLPLRAELADNLTFATLVGRAGQSLIKSLEHERFPLAEIVRRTQPPRDSSRSPLFQMACTFEKSHLREEAGRAGFLMPLASASADIGGMKQESFYIPHPTCHYDVEFIFEQTESLLRGMICYCRDLFDNTTANQMAQNFCGLIKNLTQAPDVPLSEIPWDSPRLPTIQVLEVTPKETLTQQLEDSFRHHANSIAIVGQGKSLTYRELDRQSQDISRSLRALGIGRGDLIPVIIARGPASIIAMVGVLRSGAAVVPIDADHPAIAMKDLLEDTAAKLILTDQSSRRRSMLTTAGHEVPVVILEELLVETAASGSSDNFETPQRFADDLAYVIYTSGSMGRPKGVMIEQKAIANTIRWRCENISLSDNDRVLMLLSHQFDAGFGVAMSSLAQGAALVWPTTDANGDTHKVIETIQRNQITVLPGVPSLLQLFTDHPRFADCHTIRQIWCGGERMPSDLPHQIRQQLSVRLWNFYGPTEAAVETTAHDVTDHDPKRVTPIGQPIANTDVVVLDAEGRIVPDTVPGQLAIMGQGLARGYLNRDDQTKKSFVPAIGTRKLSSRMYLTGDLGRRRSDGCLEFLGRIDHQVKLRGYRIELEEIECVLRMHPAVANAAAKIIKPDSPAAQLVAYVVPGSREKDEPFEPDHFLEDMCRHLATHLPSYKRPSQIHLISEIPLGPNGKVKRDNLPDGRTIKYVGEPRMAPETPLEQYIANLWSDLLEISNVGVHQNFFELGGSSLQAAMMTARLSNDLGVYVPTALVFDLADIASIASRLISLHRLQIELRFGKETVRRQTSRQSLQESPKDSRVLGKGFDHPLIALLSPNGYHNPIFMVHPPGGIVTCYRELALHTKADRPFFAIRSRGLHGQESLPETIQAMAADYVQAIQSVQMHGPFIVGGWSLGGVIAYEVAKQLIDQGETVAKLILLDSTIPNGASELVDSDESNQVGLEYGIDMTLHQLSELDEADQLPFLWQHAVNLGVIQEATHQEVVKQVLSDLKNLFHHHVKLTSVYRIQPIKASVLLIRPKDIPLVVKTSRDRGWGQLVKEIEVKYSPGHHHNMVAQPHVRELAKLIQESLD